MKLECIHQVAVVREPGVLIEDGRSALDLLAAVWYETGCSAMILPREALCGDFFRLPTGLAGEILQKFVNYGMALAVVGDFSAFTSKNLRDFFYESNRGKTVCFLPTEAEALERLGAER